MHASRASTSVRVFAGYSTSSVSRVSSSSFSNLLIFLNSACSVGRVFIFFSAIASLCSSRRIPLLGGLLHCVPVACFVRHLLRRVAWSPSLFLVPSSNCSSPVTRHLSLVICHPSPVTPSPPLSSFPYLLSLSPHLTFLSLVSCPLLLFSCLLFPVTAPFPLRRPRGLISRPEPLRVLFSGLDSTKRTKTGHKEN